MTALGADTFHEGSHRVLGWSINPDLSTLDYAPGAEIPVDAADKDLTLYAIIGVGYTKLYHALPDGTPTQRVRIFKYNENLNDFYGDYWVFEDAIRTDYFFLGWNSEKDGSGEWYTGIEDPTEYPPELYAQYQKAGKYYILLTSEEGLTDNQRTLYIGLVSAEPTQITLPTVTAKGSKILFFHGPIDIDSTSTQVKPGKYVANTKPDDGYYAKLVNSDGEMRYLHVGFVSFGNLVTTSFGAHDIYSDSDSIHIGYTGGKTGDSYDFNADMAAAAKAEANVDRVATFTAKFEPVNSSHYIQYIGNGAATADGESYVMDDTWSVYAENPFAAPSGMTFLGWVSKSGNISRLENWYFPGETIRHTDFGVLKAIWGQNLVIYHYPDRDTMQINTKFITGNGGYMPGELFNGWNTKADGSGEWYLPGEYDLPLGTVLELYAQYTAAPDGDYYTLVNRPGAGRYTYVSLDPATTEIVLPSDEGVLGWVRDRRDIGGQGWIDDDGILAPGTQVPVQSGDEFYALCASDPDLLFVEYHLNSTTDTVRIAYCYATPYQLELYDAQTVFDEMPSGQTFDSWNTEADGSGTTYAADAVITDGDYLTLYAQWRTSLPQWPTVNDPTMRPNKPENPNVPSKPDTPDTPDTPDRPAPSDPPAPEKPTPTIEPEKYFDDVSRDDWYYSDVAYVMEAGLMNGTDVGFEPELDASRASVATVLWNLAQNPDAAGADFTDVADGDWYADAVAWAAEEGIVAGHEDGSFDPNAAITREQFASILYRFAENLGMDLTTDVALEFRFADAAAISDYAAEAMAWAVDNELFYGVGDGLLDPQGTVTRAQLAAILHRFCEMM